MDRGERDDTSPSGESGAIEGEEPLVDLRPRLEAALADVTFPAKRSVVLLHAGGANTVDPELIDRLKVIPERTYDSLEAVERALRAVRT